VAVKQCLVLPLFYEPQTTDIDTFCRTVADVGFRAIELMNRDESTAVTVEAAHKHGLVVASMIGHASLPDGLNKPENHERIEAELRSSIDAAASWDIGGLICFSGNRNKGQSDYEGMVTCAHGLRRVVDYAEAKGVNLNMELLNSRVDHPGYQCDHADWGAALCEMVGSERFKLLFDIYHMQIMEGDVIRNIRKYHQHIGHFHTAGNPGRHDLDDLQELNYAGICRAIDETGYDLYVGHEFMAKGDRMTALLQAYEVCSR